MQSERRIKIADIVFQKAKGFEGFSARPYLCPAGACTIGFGCNLDEHREFIPFGLREKTRGLRGGSLCAVLLDAGVMWTRREAEAVLRKQIDGAIADVLRTWPWMGNEEYGMSDARFAVVADMCFNMGIARLTKFKNFISAIYVQDWERAADEMVNSRWFRQVGHRAKVLVQIMREGE